MRKTPEMMEGTHKRNAKHELWEDEGHRVKQHPNKRRSKKGCKRHE